MNLNIFVLSCASVEAWKVRRDIKICATEECINGAVCFSSLQNNVFNQ